MHPFHALNSVTSFAPLAGVSVVSGIWQGFLLAAAVGLCLRLAPKTSATLRFAIWTVVFLLIAALPLLETLFTGHAVRAAGGASLVQLDVRWSVAVAALWLSLSLVRAVDLSVHAVRLWLLQRRSTPFTAHSCCAALLTGGSRPVQLCTSTEIDRPSVIGFFAPKILIPAWLKQQLTASELEQIVFHETEHLRRGDDWFNLLQKLSLVLFPLNPILLWIERRLCFERELACDDGVLRRTKAPRAYATCLASLAERGLDRRAVSLALGALERQSQLATRVHRILRRETSLSPMQDRVLAVAVALGLLGGAAGLARCPQLVSFAQPPRQQSTQIADQVVAPAAAVPASPAFNDRSERMVNRAENVVYSGSQRPHMTLLKASIANPREPATLRPVARKPHRAFGPSVRRVQARRAAAQGWIVLTSWPDAERQSGETAAPLANTRPALLPYAAVRVNGGWLILQL